MTLPTLLTASDEICALFKAAWDANSPSVNGGSAPTIFWPAMDNQMAPPGDNSWVRFTINHRFSNQSTFGETGNRRFTRQGQIFIQIFTPLVANKGFKLAKQLAIIARNAFEGVSTTSGIWFRNVAVREIGADTTWYQINVSVSFSYDELK